MKNIQDILSNHIPQAIGVSQHYAVLIPLIQRQGETHILYEVRGANISQPGETAFPGGRVEKLESPQAAAIRETHEELHIPLESIQILGELDYFISGERQIHCFVGSLIDFDPDTFISNNEVERLFTLPLSYLMTTSPDQFKTTYQQQASDSFPFHRIANARAYVGRSIQHNIVIYNLENESLWGFTAELTRHFIGVLNQHND